MPYAAYVFTRLCLFFKGKKDSLSVRLFWGFFLSWVSLGIATKQATVLFLYLRIPGADTLDMPEECELVVNKEYCTAKVVLKSDKTKEYNFLSLLDVISTVWSRLVSFKYID